MKRTMEQGRILPRATDLKKKFGMCLVDNITQSPNN